MKCPICDKVADPAYRPFCSRRCADIDLGRWLNESYVLPMPEAEEERPENPAPSGPAHRH